jgi:formate hydrogenlyase subunit 3/multisubunit Na+/H+ antiporter MnhD subunit
VQASVALFLPRLANLLVASVALAGLHKATGSLLLDDVIRAVRRHPFLLLGVTLAMLSFGALPLTAGFPARMALLSAAWVQSPGAASAAWLGALGLVVAGLRILHAVLPPLALARLGDAQESLLGEAADTELPDASNPFAWAFLAFAVFSLLIVGLFPQAFYGDLAQFLPLFPQLVP